MDDAPAWGIEPVPGRLQVLGLLDQGLLWGNLGVSLLVLVAGTYLVPALSLPEAFLAIVLGSLIGNAMLGTAALIGADARVPSMVLMRAPLGQHGSWAPTVLNAAQCIGWAIFELLIIATAVAALSDELFGFRGQWLWTLVFGGIALALALLGPIGFVRKFVRKFAVWAVLASLLYLTWWALDGARRDRPGRRDHCVVDPARRRLQPIRARPGERLLGCGRRLLPRRRLAVDARRDPVLLAGHHRSGGAPGRRRRRWRRRDPGAPRGHGRRDGRGVRELVLRRRLDPEPRPAAAAAGAPGRGLRHGDGGRAHDRSPLLRELPADARFLLRPPLRGAARGLARVRRTGRVRRPGRPLGDARGLDRRLRRLPVAPPGRPVLVDRRRRGRNRPRDR